MKKIHRRRSRRSNPSLFESLGQKFLIVGALSSVGLAATTQTASAFNFMNALTYLQQQLMSQRVSDSFKVFTSQDAVSNTLVGETVVMAKQKQAAAEAQMAKKEQILDTYNNFINPRSLTTNSKCQAVNERENDNIAAKKADLYSKSDLLNLLNIGNYSNESDRTQSLNDTKSQLACTLELSKSGYCSLSVTGGQYFDVDFGLMDNAKRLTTNEFAATKLGILTVANPIKDQQLMNSCQGDTACIQKVANLDNKIATTSLVTNSLLTKAYNRVAVGSSYE